MSVCIPSSLPLCNLTVDFCMILCTTVYTYLHPQVLSFLQPLSVLIFMSVSVSNVYIFLALCLFVPLYLCVVLYVCLILCITATVHVSLSVPLHVSICQCAYPFGCVSVIGFFDLCVSLSVCVSMFLCLCGSMSGMLLCFMCIHVYILSVYDCVTLSMCVSPCMSLCPFVYLSMHMPLYMFLCLCITYVSHCASICSSIKRPIHNFRDWCCHAVKN
jgi:hypothetical protein